VATAGPAALIVAGAALWRVNAGADLAVAPKPASDIAAAPPAPTPATGPATPAGQAPPAGALVASGYVVARRKATVAAEITGKVKDLMIDEGQAVEAGQVLARLDSVLAEKDLALSQSRASASEAAVAAIAADLADAER